MHILLPLQMIELRNNPSGEIQVSSIPTKNPTTSRHFSNTDAHNIDELKESIHSLKSQIEMVGSYILYVCVRRYGCGMWAN